MDYKAYLSSLFYLTEAMKYLSDEPKQVTLNQVINLCRQGFNDTNVFGFKVYELFFERYSSLTYYSKNYLNKNKGTFFFRDYEINERFLRPRVFHGQERNDGDYELVAPLNLVNGPVVIKVNFSENQDDEDGYDASWTMSLTFDNYRNYTEADIRLLMDRIVDFLPNRQ